MQTPRYPNRELAGLAPRLLPNDTISTITTCYLSLQEAITEDHWLRMRDTGSLDEEGFLALSGRCADAVKLQDEVSCDWRRAVT